MYLCFVSAVATSPTAEMKPIGCPVSCDVTAGLI